MKLYVNGDSHAAAAEAVNPHAFAEDDSRYFYLGRAPHPENAAVSWARRLGQSLKATVHNDSESASSNARITRTTWQWIHDNRPWLEETVMIISWSTWERQEWLIDDRYYQINASGQDHVPESHQSRYRQYIADVDWQRCTQEQHQQIWDFHQDLNALGIRHLFFNGNNHFESIAMPDRHDWSGSYIDPYNPKSTYDQWLKNNGHHTVSPISWHFGAEAHAAWSNFLLQYGIEHQLWR